MVVTFLLLNLCLPQGIKRIINKQSIENWEIHKKKIIWLMKGMLLLSLIGKNESQLCVRAKWKKDQL